MAILALDQGTSATKALIVGDDGQVIASASAPLEISHSQVGASTAKAEDMWQSIITAAKAAIDSDGFKKSKQKISAVGLANQGESILAWDKKTGKALSEVIIWQDSRSSEYCTKRQDKSELVLSKSGLAIDPYFVAPKILWLKEFLPNLSSQAVITTTDTWLISRLTGAYVTDRATASRTLLFDLHTKDWSQELANIWQLDIANLPTLINNNQIIGEINHPDLLFLKNIPLAAAIVDQPAALLAEECFTQGSAKCTFGTGAFLLVNIGDKPKISKNGLATSLAWQINSKSTVSSAYYLDGQVFTAATAITWLVDNQFITNANQIDSLPDADSVITAPGFAGYGAPLWKPNAKAAIAGLGLHHTKSHIARSVVNGIAAQVADLLTAITQDGVSVSTLKVDGGLTQSNTLMQMVADLAQIDVELYPHPDATAIGVANLATLAINPTLTLADLKPASKGAKNFSPKWSADQANNYLKQWRKLQLVTSDLT